MIENLYNLWFSTKCIFPNGLNILLISLILCLIVNIIAYKTENNLIQLICLIIALIFICIFSIFTIGLIFLKSYKNKKI